MPLQNTKDELRLLQTMLRSRIHHHGGFGYRARHRETGAPVLLGCLAMIACYIPSRRSLKIDSLKALREE
jgi:hypothetical protein